LVRSSTKLADEHSEGQRTLHRHKTNLEASANKQLELHNELVKQLQIHVQETHGRFQAQRLESSESHQCQVDALQALDLKQLAMHEALESDLQAHAEWTQDKFEQASQNRSEVHHQATAALQAAQSEQLTLHMELQEQLQAHSKLSHDQFEAQQAENHQVQRQHSAMEMKESRQFGRHEHLASDVTALRSHLKKVHERFEGQHADHQEVQDALRTTMKTEHEEVVAASAASNDAFTCVNWFFIVLIEDSISSFVAGRSCSIVCFSCLMLSPVATISLAIVSPRCVAVDIAVADFRSFDSAASLIP